MTEFHVNPYDTNSSPTSPGTLLAPFDTLARANAAVSPGDKVLIHPAVYREAFRPVDSGVSWIATEPGVVVDPSVPVPGPWTHIGGGVYTAPITGLFATSGGLLVDDEVHSPPALSSGVTVYTPETTTRISSGSFFHDLAGGTIYLNLGGADPNGKVVRAFTVAGIIAEALDSLLFEGILFSGTNGYGARFIGGANHVLRRCSATRTASGGLRFEAPTPQLFKPTDGGAGSLAAGTYTWQITAIVGGVETFPGPGNTLTLAAGRRAALQWAGVVGATSYNVYGRGATGRRFIANVAAPGSGFPSFTDDGTITPTGANPPVTSTVKCTASLMDECHTWQLPSHGQALFAADTCTIRGADSHHNSVHGVSLQYDSNDNTVELCKCYRNAKPLGDRAANGIQCDSFGIGTPGSQRNKVRRNACWRNQDSGVSVYQGSHDCVVQENLAWGNGDHGFDTLNSQRVHYVNNTAHGNVTAGMQAEGDVASPASQGVRMWNNVSVDNGVDSPRTTGNYRIDAPTSADAQLDHNLSHLTVPAAAHPPGPSNGEMTWGAGGAAVYDTLADFKAAVPSQMVHGLSADPKFRAPDYGDFRLEPDSAARGVGSSAVTDFDAHDHAGNPQPSPPDAGALAYA